MKMTLSDIREAYEELSGKASSISRQLSLYGIAIFWAFCFINDTVIIDKCFFYALLCFLFSLAIDLLQYCIQTYIWYNCYKRNIKNKHLEEKTSVEIKESKNRTAWTLFYVKIGSMIFGYGILIYRISQDVQWQ